MQDSCSQCNNFFNLTNRRPITIDEFGCTWCLECVNISLIDNPARQIYCQQDNITVTLSAVLLFDEYSVENMKAQLLNQSKNEINLKSSEFKLLIDKVNKVLGKIVTVEEYEKIDLAYSLEDPLHAPQNRQPQRQNQAEEEKQQFNQNPQNFQRLIDQSHDQMREEFKEAQVAISQNWLQKINESQSIMREELQLALNAIPQNCQQKINGIREEFKNALNAIEINQNQINNQNNESIKLNKTSLDNNLVNLKQFKINLETKMTNLSDKYRAIDISFETQNKKFMNLEKSCKSLNDSNNDYSQKQKLLQNKIDKTQIELNQFVQKVKQDIDKHDTLLLDAKTQIANERSLLDTLQLKIQEVNENNSNNSCDFLEDQVSKPNDDDVDDNDDDDDDNDQDEDDNENEDNDRELMTYQIYGKELMRRYFRELVDVEIQKQQTSLLQSQIADSSNKQFSLLYRGSRDGFSADKFHELCDYKGPTVSFIISECAQVFGGFTSIPWTSNSLFYSDPSAFVFSLNVYIWKWL
eukprot:403343512